MFEAFARPMRRVSSSTLCLVGHLEENCRRVRIPGEASTRGSRNAVSSVHRRCESLPGEWRTRMPHRNHLRGKRTLGKRLPTRNPRTGRAFRWLLIFTWPSQRISVGATRRWRQPDEDDDAITAGVGRDVDVEIGLPVVNGPNVTGLIDHHTGLTHHWDEAGRSA